MNAERFALCVEALGISLSSDQVAQFAAFEEALYLANEVMNLTRVARDECWTRHFLDSLLFQDLLPHGSQVLDIGTGPGFPAWPLACARPDLKVTALDSNGKMLGFLRQFPLQNLKIIQERAEEWKTPSHFDISTGRAVAPLPTQLELSARPLKIGGLVVPMRTPADLESAETIDLEPLGLTFVEAIQRPLPGTDIVRCFPIYRKAKKTMSGFPRRWSEMKSYPL